MLFVAVCWLLFAVVVDCWFLLFVACWWFVAVGCVVVEDCSLRAVGFVVCLCVLLLLCVGCCVLVLWFGVAFVCRCCTLFVVCCVFLVV